MVSVMLSTGYHGNSYAKYRLPWFQLCLVQVTMVTVMLSTGYHDYSYAKYRLPW